MKIQRVKGMYDILPEQSAIWERVESSALATLKAYGYQQIRLPVLERTKLFAQAIGQETDVVSKEMYSFDDRNNESLTMRPEGTAGCVRAMVQAGLIHHHISKVWYNGPMFRYENVQRGRNRQFYQIGGEATGVSTPDIDAEMVLLLQAVWADLGLDNLTLEINSLGDAETRQTHRQALQSYLGEHRSRLDDDSIRRLDSNPLRILDSKNPNMQSLIAEAPVLLDYLDDESTRHFTDFKAILDACGVEYVVNPCLVRGLDYYNRTVFEFKTDALGAQGTVCGGGRYDSLIERQGGRATAAIGFSMGVDRLVELMMVCENNLAHPAPDVYVVIDPSGKVMVEAQHVVEQLRKACPQTVFQMNLGAGSFKAQFKRADKSGAQLALVLGEDEMVSRTAVIKNLRDRDAIERTVDLNDLGSPHTSHLLSV